MWSRSLRALLRHLRLWLRLLRLRYLGSRWLRLPGLGREHIFVRRRDIAVVRVSMDRLGEATRLELRLSSGAKVEVNKWPESADALDTLREFVVGAVTRDEDAAAWASADDDLTISQAAAYLEEEDDGGGQRPRGHEILAAIHSHKLRARLDDLERWRVRPRDLDDWAARRPPKESRNA